MGELGRQVQQLTEKQDLIIAVEGGDPTVLYLSHRKGWHANPDELTVTFVLERSKRGARYLVGIYEYFQDSPNAARLDFLKKYYSLVYDSPRAFIIKLN